MIDQLVTIQLISGILKHQKAEVDDDVNLLCLNPFATVRKSNALRSSLRSFKIQKICTAAANFHPCRMKFKSLLAILNKYKILLGLQPCL